ncbi:hemagglutinin [Bifidobacterium sp. B4107]|uniref:hemagglutinin n=1 Tax=unclassified Bifidobacterium TaxID=2608897 RepID=UPI00226B5C11|nr:MULTISPECIES: hemagglutinin [unclassified Bifidobacterium]MCX8648366.1 hemagglutinin [Bifidobacterium sp. B4107]MCX8652642.1 hemagglutinin [Bifidobacterium sp. B4111]MCX8658994.1 hemagglutinin [Bifidobacterium sp. B4114]
MSKRPSGRSRKGGTKRGGTSLRRAQTLGAALMAVVLVVALCILAVRFVSYRLMVGRIIRHQEELSQEYVFNPGKIITDHRFHDTVDMNADDVQAFLNKHEASCNGSTCLRSLQMDVPDRPGDGLCDAYKGGKKQSAAQIIDGAARSCGISQKVLLTMLEKEQHLVATNHPPTQVQLRSAMGLSCPDDADCDTRYAGFFNQVYGAAHRFRYYQAHRNQYAYQTKALNDVRFSPDVSCGSGKVYIENDATALLYIYTPYQPNEAALQAGDGEGDRCSSYGNRNFVIIYNNWFGRSDQ